MHPLRPGVHVRNETVRSRGRSGLMATTALQAAVAVMLTHPAAAQPAPTARPTGGVVVAGQAAIAQSTVKTTIDQSSQNAAVNWQTFNVGSQHTVQINNPATNSITLNRVIGPDPSQIAGKIQSNGVVVITNQAGLTFYKGAQVNTSGLVVSSAGMTNKNLMDGKLVFDQPGNPNARIVNNGEITIANQGLAALVAPQVVNAGVIRANMGKVILAGAEAHTLDLYGDGMVSINVTKQVTKAANGSAALVTNTGVIEAQGGTVVLTAEAVDGVVQTLVNAGGKISASSAAGRKGKVVIAGRGGDVVLNGDVSAEGVASGTAGGEVVANATGTVAIASTARISTSGPAGGGSIALGTTLARAKGGSAVASTRTAKGVAIAAGATIAADATAKGKGGQVAILSTDMTAMNGTITAKGGPQGGDGGFAEISGHRGLTMGSSTDVTAPLGNAGTILIDPDILNIFSANATTDPGLISNGNTVLAGAGASIAQISAGTINAMGGNIVLQAQSGIYAGGTIVLAGSATSLTLQAIDGSVLVAAPITGSNAQSLSIKAGTKVEVEANLTAGTIGLNGPTGIEFNANTVTATVLKVDSAFGDIVQLTQGKLAVGTLTSSAPIGGNVTLPSFSNSIGTIGALIPGAPGALATGGSTTINNGANLTIAGNVVAGFNQGDGIGQVVLTPAQSRSLAGSGAPAASIQGDAIGQFVSISAPGQLLTVNGEVVAGPGGNVSLAAGAINVAQNGSIVLPVIKADRSIVLTAGTITQTAGVINGGTVDLNGSGLVSLSGGRVVATVGTIGFGAGPVSVGGNAQVATVNEATDINITGNLTQGDQSYIGANGGVTVGGLFTQAGGAMMTVGNGTFGAMAQSGGITSIGGNLSVGTGTGVAGWAGSAATSGSFAQTGSGLIIANGDANIFATGTVAQSGPARLAAGGTLGVTTASDLYIAGTVAAAGTTGFMLLSTGAGATVTLDGEGRAAGPQLAVNAGNVIHGNAIQAPNGVVKITSSETQSIATIGQINAANAPVSGYELFAPGATLGVAESLPAVPSLQLPNPNTIVDPFAPPIPVSLMGTSIDIEGRIVTSTLGLYAKTLISEAGLGLINTGTLTGSAGVLRSGALPPGLTDLGWNDPVAFGWLSPGADTIGNVSLVSPGRWNNVLTLSDFRTTGDFVFSDLPMTGDYTLRQIGTLQAGSAIRPASTAGTLAVSVGGTLIVDGVISGGIDDGQSRPGVNVALSATPGVGTFGAIVIGSPNESSLPPLIAAVPNGTQGGLVSLTVDGPSGRVQQQGGQINGGGVSITTDTVSGSIDLAGTSPGGPPNGRIVATGTNGSVSLTTGQLNIGAGATLAAVNEATDVLINAGFTHPAGSLIQANRDIVVNGVVTETGGNIVAARNVGLQGLTQTAGTISAGGALSIGVGSGVAGWGGSAAATGTFNQSGGVAVAGGPINVFTTGQFVQGGGALLASGGTLGVTAMGGISLGGIVSAAGAPSGFMLLANGGYATITGLLAGPQLAAASPIVPGNAVQAPNGAVQIAGGPPVFGVAGAVTAASTPISGYTLVCAGCTIGPSISAGVLPALALPAWQPSTPTTETSRIPLTLVAETLDLNSTIHATNLGLYVKTLIAEPLGGYLPFIYADVLTGSAGAASSLAPGLVALGWPNAAAIGWQNSTGSVSMPMLTNTITTLSDFTTTGDFNLQSQSLILAGSVVAGGNAAITVWSRPLIQTGGALVGQNVSVTNNDPYSSGITFGGGSVVATAGTISFASPSTTIGAGELVATVGPGADITFTGALTQQADSRISLNGGILSAASVTQTGGTISSTGPSVLVASPGSIAIGGTVASEGATTLLSGQNLTVASTGVVRAGASLDVLSGGSIAAGGTFASGGAMTLRTAFDLTETSAGVVRAGTSLDVLSGGSIAAGGTFASAGAMTLQSGQSLAEASTGVVQAGSSLNTVSGGSIGIGGLFSAGGAMNLQAALGITETPDGVIQAAVLTGTAGGAVALNGPNEVSTLGAFSTPNSAFSLTNARDLTLGGIINAASVTLAAPTSTLTLGTGSGFAGVTGGDSDPRSNEPFPVAGGAGIYLQAANIANGNPGLTIAGGSPVALSFALTGPGKAALGNLQQPGAKLFLDLANGTADGTINVAGLQVRYGPPANTLMNLLGSVGGVSGQSAATISFISPGPRVTYQLNGCVIASNCLPSSIITSVNGAQNVRNLTTIPIINGLQDLQMGGMLQDFNTDTLLPDVADRDY